MIKAVFFDLFNTLARHDPPRELLYQQAFQEVGIEIPPKDIIRALLYADQHYFAENVKRPIRERSPEEQIEVLSIYPRMVLEKAKAKVEAPGDLSAKIIKKLLKDYRNMGMVLFDDVLPTLKSLKERNLVTGLLTNADTRGASAYSDKLGMTPYLSFIATSQEAGAEKPSAPIFLLALQRAGVKAQEAVHVGDQYHADVLGARGTGISPILIDRYDINSEVTDCLRITSLRELDQYIN